MKGYIYQIINKINNKRYIGQTFVPNSRKKRHFSDLRNHRHDNKYLQKAFDEYGEECFLFEIMLEIEDCSQEKLDEKEIEYIQNMIPMKMDIIVIEAVKK